MKPSREFVGLWIVLVLLIVLQLVSVVLAWSLDPVAQKSQAEFALLLSADLVGFAVVSYIVRSRNSRGYPRELMVLAGSSLALGLMILVLLV